MWEIAITNQQILGSTSCIIMSEKYIGMYNINRLIFSTSDIAQKNENVLTFNQLSFPRKITNK